MRRISLRWMTGRFPLCQIIQMYFSFDNKLPYRKLAVLYNNIIAAKETEPEVYHKYRKAMGRFSMDQAQLRHIDDNLAVLYEDMLELGFINEELSAAFQILYILTSLLYLISA